MDIKAYKAKYIMCPCHGECSYQLFFSVKGCEEHSLPHTHIQRSKAFALSLCLRDPGTLGGRVRKPLCLGSGH